MSDNINAHNAKMEKGPRRGTDSRTSTLVKHVKQHRMHTNARWERDPGLAQLLRDEGSRLRFMACVCLSKPHAP